MTKIKNCYNEDKKPVTLSEACAYTIGAMIFVAMVLGLLALIKYFLIKLI